MKPILSVLLFTAILSAHCGNSDDEAEEDPDDQNGKKSPFRLQKKLGKETAVDLGEKIKHFRIGEKKKEIKHPRGPRASGSESKGPAGPYEGAGGTVSGQGGRDPAGPQATRQTQEPKGASGYTPYTQAGKGKHPKQTGYYTTKPGAYQPYGKVAPVTHPAYPLGANTRPLQIYTRGAPHQIYTGASGGSAHQEYGQGGASGGPPGAPGGPSEASQPSGTGLIDTDLDTKHKEKAKNSVFESATDDKSRTTHHFIPKDGYIFQKVLHNGVKVWQSTDHVRCQKVTLINIGSPKKIMMVYLTDGSKEIMTKEKKGGRWIRKQ